MIHPAPIIVLKKGRSHRNDPGSLLHHCPQGETFVVSWKQRSDRRHKCFSLLALPACKIVYEHFRHETPSKEDPTGASKAIVC